MVAWSGKKITYFVFWMLGIVLFLYGLIVSIVRLAGKKISSALLWTGILSLILGAVLTIVFAFLFFKEGGVTMRSVWRYPSMAY